MKRDVAPASGASPGFGAQQLDRDLAIELGIVRDVDLSHRAAADQAEHDEPPDLGAAAQGTVGLGPRILLDRLHAAVPPIGGCADFFTRRSPRRAGPSTTRAAAAAAATAASVARRAPSELESEDHAEDVAGAGGVDLDGRRGRDVEARVSVEDRRAACAARDRDPRAGGGESRGDRGGVGVVQLRQDRGVEARWGDAPRARAPVRFRRRRRRGAAIPAGRRRRSERRARRAARGRTRRRPGPRR